jgi:hypothetical protein
VCVGAHVELSPCVLAVRLQCQRCLEVLHRLGPIGHTEWNSCFRLEVIHSLWLCYAV